MATPFADPDRCPDCREPFPDGPRTTCTHCGLPLEGTTAQALFVTLQRADRLLAELRRTASGSLPEAEPVVPVVVSPVVVSPPRPSRAWTVPGVLLGLGALCLLVGAIVFLAFAWAVLGVGGRTAVLLGLTGVVAGVTTWSARRGLRGAAEALAVVAGVFLALDVAGGFTAGWFGEVEPVTAILVGSLAVAALLALADLVLGSSRAGHLVALQVETVLALLAAYAAAVARFEHSLTTLSATAVVLLVAVALAVRRAGQRVLAAGVVVLAVLAWSGLLLDGTVALAAHEAWGVTAVPWSEVAPLLVAAALVAPVTIAPASELVRGTVMLASLWLTGAGVGAALVTTPTAVAVAASAVALLLAAVALLPGVGGALRPWVVGAAAGYAVAAAVPVVMTGYGTVTGLARVVADRSAPDLFIVAPTPAPVAAWWTPPLVAAGLAAVAATLTHAGRTRTSGGLTLATAAGVTVVVLQPSLLLATSVAVLLATGHLVALVRDDAGWAAPVHGALAAGWAVAGGLLATYHPAPAVVVAAALAAVASAGALRGVLALAALAPPLVAATVVALGWLAHWTPEWTGLVAVAATGVHAVAAGSLGRRAGRAVRSVVYISALPTALVACAVAGLTTPSDVAASWLVADLVVAGVGAGSVSVLERSRAIAGVAAVLQLGATWVRLQDAEVATTEAYTLPLAALLLAFGAWTMWRDRGVDSVRVLTPGLGVALLPSLLLVVEDPLSVRAALLALACGVAVAVGAAGRLRAPLLAGAAVGALLVVVELAPYQGSMPRWLMLGVAGSLLLVAGVRWEHLATLGRRGWGAVADLR